MKLLDLCKLNDKGRKEYFKGRSITADEFSKLRSADILDKLELEITKDWKESYSRSKSNTSIEFERNYCISKEYNIWIELKLRIFKSGKGISSSVEFEYLGHNLAEPGKFIGSTRDNSVQIFATQIGLKRKTWSDYREVTYSPSTDISKDFDGFCKEVIKAREDRQPYIDLLFTDDKEKLGNIHSALKKFGLLKDGYNQFDIAGLNRMFDASMIEVATKMQSFDFENWIILCNMHAILRDPNKESIYDVLDKYHLTPNQEDFDKFLNDLEPHLDEIKLLLSDVGDYNTRLEQANKEYVNSIIEHAKSILPEIKKKYNIKSKDLHLSLGFLNSMQELNENN